MLYYFKAFYDYVKQRGLFEHRADIADYDWDVTDFPNAGQWYDLDLTSIVPEHTKAVLLRGVMRSTTTGKYFILRRKGYTQGKVSSYIDVSVANTFERGEMVVGVGPDRIIQGQRNNVNVDTIFAVVKGWWF